MLSASWFILIFNSLWLISSNLLNKGSTKLGYITPIRIVTNNINSYIYQNIFIIIIVWYIIVNIKHRKKNILPLFPLPISNHIKKMEQSCRVKMSPVPHPWKIM